MFSHAMTPWFTVFTDYANLSMWHWKFGGEGHSEGPNHWESATAETTTREEREEGIKRILFVWSVHTTKS
jgi:hypothetical protein